MEERREKEEKIMSREEKNWNVEGRNALLQLILRTVHTVNGMYSVCL